MKGFYALAGAIVAEILGTSMLKMSEGFSLMYPSVGVILGFGISFYCLSVSLRTIPLSLAYAIWSGVGTALTALIGILIWGDSLTAMAVVGIAIIIGGVVLLNTSSHPEKVMKSE
ncbi:hypothetical protein AN963_00145 [Brevibacillus choshinensis]|uniref:Multidrug transporter n=1 Tax=Brevibacillus choshinensis TaxID=54911 RepID=A0ABR5N9N8_BRECH|nr:multidrug efflux SMR transporter [Brevibacillus choshinensis]KQL48278.1 hypothetical protein AN963_00145 [Brevibacillus choshinensis]